MAMTPQDIQAQQFHVKFRGFDMSEVDAFLEEVGENVFQLLQENQKLREQMEVLERYRQDFFGQEKDFKKAIIAAQKIADEMRERSTREAEETLATARLEVEQFRREAESEKKSLQEEIDQLRESRDNVREEIKAVLHSYLEQLEKEIPAGPARQSAWRREARPAVATGRERENFDDLFQKMDLPEMTDLEDDAEGDMPFEPGENPTLPESATAEDALSPEENAVTEWEPAVTFTDEEEEEEESEPLPSPRIS